MGPGAWQHEPDKAVWIDEASGFDCMIVRNRGGALCGYVGLPPGHPLHGVEYDSCTVDGCDDWDCEHVGTKNLRVHGGLTFAGACHEGGNPAERICHIPQPGRPAEVWWLGFDTAHYQDHSPGYAVHLPEPLCDGEVYRDIDYVTTEVGSLAQQLEAVQG